MNEHLIAIGNLVWPHSVARCYGYRKRRTANVQTGEFILFSQFKLIVVLVNRIFHRRKRLPAQQGKPMDHLSYGTMPTSPQQTGEAFQVYRYGYYRPCTTSTVKIELWTSDLQILLPTSTVTCIIMQKNGAGLQTASTCFFDSATDGR